MNTLMVAAKKNGGMAISHPEVVKQLELFDIVVCEITTMSVIRVDGVAQPTRRSTGAGIYTKNSSHHTSIIEFLKTESEKFHLVPLASVQISKTLNVNVICVSVDNKQISEAFKKMGYEIVYYKDL